MSAPPLLMLALWHCVGASITQALRRHLWSRLHRAHNHGPRSCMRVLPCVKAPSHTHTHARSGPPSQKGWGPLFYNTENEALEQHNLIPLLGWIWKKKVWIHDFNPVKSVEEHTRGKLTSILAPEIFQLMPTYALESFQEYVYYDDSMEVRLKKQNIS